MSAVGETVFLQDYNVELAELLEDTEGHPDALVRSCRKMVTQAALALRAAYDRAQPTPSMREPAPRLDLTPTTVREWAAAHGWQVSQTGRLPQKVVAAYVEAHAPHPADRRGEVSLVP